MTLRAARALAPLLVAALVARAARADAPPADVTVAADIDDDDDDGVADGAAPQLAGRALADVAPLLVTGARAEIARGDGPPVARLVADGAPVPAGAPAPRGARSVVLQGIAPGRAALELAGVRGVVRVVGAVPLDGAGRVVDLATSHASLSRTPPLAYPGAGAISDDDALTWVVVADADDLPAEAALVSTDAAGARLDALAHVTLRAAACPAGFDARLRCRATPPIRASLDEADRDHPLSRARLILAQVGGRIALHADGRKLASLRVGGPRGVVDRVRARLRVTLVRDLPGGRPPFGATDDAAVAIARRQVAFAGAIWGQCGVSFGPVADVPVRVVDPPPVHLVAVGCELGLPASGGEIRLRVDGRDLAVPIATGATPRRAAHALAAALERAGFAPRVSVNPRIEPAADGTTDVLVRRRDGAPAIVDPPRGGKLSTDATLGVCLGEVDLSDGLDHFTDVDAPSGTVEERALAKWLDDGDPSSIDVVLVPAFAGGGRIGESFIAQDRSSIRNVVLVDRGGVRADRATFALAHELGHVLLDVPGHPDDFGIDQPTQLMDADAADPSAFGPRRLGEAACARMMRQSGPASPAPLLTRWPLFAPRAPARPRAPPRVAGR